MLALASMLAGCTHAPTGAQGERAPIRVVLLNTDGVPMPGYGVSPHLPSLSNELNRDIRYWAINGRFQPNLFIVGVAAVQEGCVNIHDSFSGTRYLGRARICGLTLVETRAGCDIFRYRLGYVVAAPIELTWRPSMRDQARVGDCVAEGLWSMIPEAEVTARARVIMYDYLYARGAPGPEL